MKRRRGSTFFIVVGLPIIVVGRLRMCAFKGKADMFVATRNVRF
jgi:hypothetical protein